MDDISVLDLLRKMNDGRLLDDMSERLEATLEAVRRSRKQGVITLTIKVVPDKEPQIEEVGISGDVTAKIPHVERAQEWFYLTDENSLSTRNPRQPKLPPGTVRMPSPDERGDLEDKKKAAGDKA